MNLEREKQMLLMAYVDGETSPEDTLRAQALIASDDEARRFAESIRDLDRAIPAAGAIPVSSGEWTRVWEGIKAGMGRTASRPRSRVIRWAAPLALAAGLLIAVSVALLRSPRAEEPANGFAAIEMLAPTEVIILDIPDDGGTIIWTVTDDNPCPVSL